MTRFHGLDLNLLVTLDVLLVERNLTRAADRLNLTQPAISNALTRLREHFDDDLLVRIGRDMERTPFAQQLLKPLQDALQHLRGLALARPRFDPLTASRNYQIVASDFIASVFLGDLILHLEEAAPNVTVELLPLNDDSIGKVSRGEADAIIWPVGKTPIPGYTTRRLFVERFVCIAGCENSSVGATASIEELNALKRVVPPYKTYWASNAIETQPVGPVVALPFTAMPWFVAKSDFVAVIPERLAAMYEHVLPLRRIALTPPLPAVPFCAQSHPDSLSDPFKGWMLDQMELTAQVRCTPESAPRPHRQASAAPA
jgi:DNA-binding transcriptional LysR family regulator